jgi:hypothetical protein
MAAKTRSTLRDLFCNRVLKLDVNPLTCRLAAWPCWW